jgi:flagellar hook assembly protein FlgD
MKRKVLMGTVAALAVAALLGCQTTKQLIDAAQSEIQVEQSGFSPNGSTGQNALSIEVLLGNAPDIKTWKVEAVSAGVAHRTWTGTGASLPSSLSWDGTDDSGAIAPEGTYTARLAVAYAKTYKEATAESTSFVLDVSPPSGAIRLDPARFTPADSGVTGPLTLAIDARSATARMDSWSMDVLDDSGALVKSFSGQWPAAAPVWDGSIVSGGFVSPAATYHAVATVRDEFGNSAQLTADVPVAEVPPSTRQAAVLPGAAGFSPGSATGQRSISLALTVGNRDALKRWSLSVAHAEKGVQMAWNGDSGSLPASVAWDGQTPAGKPAPEGPYTATLSVDYGMSYQSELVKSAPFILDVTPPAGNVSVNPVKLAPDGKGGIQPVSFTVFGASQTAAVKSWALDVLDAGGKVVAGFKDAWPAATATWDGALAAGGRADPTRVYTYAARILDEFGNQSTVRGSLVTGELPAVQGAVAVTPSAEGFSPNGDRLADTIGLALSWGQPNAVRSWKVDISYPGLGAERSFSGTGDNLPRSITWDGKTDSGSAAVEGSYTAALSIDYGSFFAPAKATSAPFLLDVTPPRGSIALSEPLFSPIESSSTITLTLQASSTVAKIDSWTMEILDPEGSVFKTFSGKWPVNQATWDGRGIGGDLVQSAEDYPVVARLRDQFGNTGTVKAVIPVDILVEKTAAGYRILASRIFFKAYTADYTDVSPDLAAQNKARLEALAAKLARFPDYGIRIVGHAVMINWDDPVKGRAEQDEILVPLSKARAAAVARALEERGLAPERLATEGVGAADQLVPDSDLRDRWQNRRVALFLEK